MTAVSKILSFVLVSTIATFIIPQKLFIDQTEVIVDDKRSISQPTARVVETISVRDISDAFR